MTYVAEGWWHPNVKSGQVHDHKSNQPATMHRLCEKVYTLRGPDPLDAALDLIDEAAAFVSGEGDDCNEETLLGRLCDFSVGQRGFR